MVTFTLNLDVDIHTLDVYRVDSHDLTDLLVSVVIKLYSKESTRKNRHKKRHTQFTQIIHPTVSVNKKGDYLVLVRQIAF